MHPHHPMKPFTIPADWSPEQAFAVVDLLDELREHIWGKYQVQLFETYTERQSPEPTAKHATPSGEHASPLSDDNPF